MVRKEVASDQLTNKYKSKTYMENNKSFLSFDLNRGFTSPNLPIATFYQGDIELNFIIDTGSDDNIISSDALLKLKHEILDSEKPLATAKGMDTVKTCRLTFQDGSETFTSNFLISDHLKESFDKIHEWNVVRIHGMIGSKFLREHNIVLDFSNMKAYNKK